MHLYIHFGIYKTGSSFLQTICARNRQLLQESGYYFPESERESDMLAGRVSPGNAWDLAYLLKAGDLQKTILRLQNWEKVALRKKCDKILLSTESIIHAFAAPKGLETLFNAIAKTGITQVSAFGFFRDFVDHCLSTYKHRAKRGKIPDFTNWVRDTYETPRVLENFLKVFQQYPVDWHFRKYYRDGVQMAQAFFEDWLKVPLPAIPEQQSVNPSLTLSELQFIRYLHATHPQVIPHVYQRLLALPKSFKQKDADLERQYREQALHSLKKWQPTIDRLNGYLPEKDLLNNLPEAQEVGIDQESVSLSFSEWQLQMMCMGLADAGNWQVQLKQMLQQIYRWIKAITNPGKQSILQD
jgi:hypothetical protein